MRCKSVKRLLPEYIEGTLSPERVEQLEVHFDSCSDCEQELRFFERTLRLASNLPVEYPSTELWEEFWPSLRVKINQAQSAKQSPVPLWTHIHSWKIATAGCWLITIASLWLILSGGTLGFLPTQRISTLDELIPQSLIATETSIKQLQEQLNYQLQSLDGPLGWGAESPFVDELSLDDSTRSNDIFNQLFQIIATEIDRESFEYQEISDVAPSMNNESFLIALE